MYHFRRRIDRTPSTSPLVAMGEEINADELARVWRARRTVAKMLLDRNYMIDDKDVTQTLEEFKARFTEERLQGGYASNRATGTGCLCARSSETVPFAFPFWRGPFAGHRFEFSLPFSDWRVALFSAAGLPCTTFKDHSFLC